ncbi:MAG: hypothetical protein ACR2N7_08930 [Acidimicrobiia bacterium]
MANEPIQYMKTDQGPIDNSVAISWSKTTNHDRWAMAWGITWRQWVIFVGGYVALMAAFLFIVMVVAIASS